MQVVTDAALRVCIVGGGPGGLFLATLLKVSDPARHVTVIEQNPAGATYGFGVAFSDLTLGYLDDVAPALQKAITSSSVRWDHIDITHRGRHFRCDGHALSALGRPELLSLLRAQAESHGVQLTFDQRLEDPGRLGDHDLVVGADGVNSVVRNADPDAFGAEVRPGRSKYIWFGAEAPAGDLFDALSFAFEVGDAGPFGIHAYPYGTDDGSMTAVIVETDEDTWRRAGLDRHGQVPLPPGASDRHSQQYCERLFASQLRGRALIGNNSRWTNFLNVRCARWHAGNRVLIGDAVHTAHFSLGSGTKLAMEDAIALDRALATCRRGDDLSAALEAYEDARRPDVERLQDAAEPSRMWWERFADVVAAEPEGFASHFMTRTGLMTWERLRQRDHRFTDAVEHWFRPSGPAGAGTTTPLLTPFATGALRLPNRVVARVRPRAAGDDAVTSEAVAYARCGAGMVIVPAPAGSAAATAPWSGAVAQVQAVDVPAAVELWPPIDVGDPATALPDWQDVIAPAAAVGIDAIVVQVELAGAHAALGTSWPEVSLRPGGALPAALAAARRDGGGAAIVVSVAWPQTADGNRRLDQAAEFAVSLRQHGADVIGVATSEPGPVLPHMHPAMALVLIADAVRNRGGVSTMLIDAVASDDEAVTWLLSDRADLVCGAPRLAGMGWDQRPGGPA